MPENFERILELDKSQIELQAKIDTETILLAREKNTLDETKIFANQQILDFEKDQLNNPSNDPLKAYKSFEGDLKSGLKENLNSMGEYNSKAFQATLQAKMNSLNQLAIKKTLKIEKQRALGVAGIHLADYKTAFNSGDVRAMQTSFSALSQQVNSLVAQKFMTPEEGIKLLSDQKIAGIDAYTTNALANNLEDEDEFGAEYAYSKLRSQRDVYDGASPEKRKAVAKRILSLKKQINAVGDEALKVKEGSASLARGNFISDPNHFKSYVASATELVHSYQRNKSGKNNKTMDLKIKRVNTNLAIASFFNSKPEALSSNYSPEAIIKALKINEEKDSFVQVHAVSEILKFKSKFDTSTQEGAKNFYEWKKKRESSGESGRNIASTDQTTKQIDENAKTENKNYDISEYIKDDPKKYKGDLFLGVQEIVKRTDNIFEGMKKVPGQRKVLTSEDNAVVVETIKNLLNNQEVGTVIELNNYLNKNDIHFNGGVLGKTSTDTASLSSMFKQVNKFSTLTENTQVLSEGFFKGMNLILDDSNPIALSKNKELFDTLVSKIRADSSAMASIRRVANNQDGGVKFIALSLLGQLSGNIGLRGRVFEKGGLTDLVGSDERISRQWEDYIGSVKSLNNSVFVQKGRNYDQGFLRALGYSPDKDENAGLAVEVLSNALSRNEVFSLDTQKGSNRVRDPYLQSMILTLAKTALPGQVITAKSLEDGLIVVREEEDGNLVFYHSNEDRSANTPLTVGGSAVVITKERMDRYQSFLEGDIKKDSKKVSEKEMKTTLKERKNIFSLITSLGVRDGITFLVNIFEEKKDKLDLNKFTPPVGKLGLKNVFEDKGNLEGIDFEGVGSLFSLGDNSGGEMQKLESSPMFDASLKDVLRNDRNTENRLGAHLPGFIAPILATPEARDLLKRILNYFKEDVLDG